MVTSYVLKNGKYGKKFALITLVKGSSDGPSYANQNRFEIYHGVRFILPI